MPVLDGFEATKQIRKISSDKAPYIIAITASSMKKDMEHCYQVGMNAFIAKPYNLKDTGYFYDSFKIDVFKNENFDETNLLDEYSEKNYTLEEYYKEEDARYKKRKLLR